MLELVTTGQFRKDYKRMKKRGCDMEMLEKLSTHFWRSCHSRSGVEIMD